MANDNLPAKQNDNFNFILNSETVKKRFHEILNQNAPAFMSALLNIYQNNKLLQECDARSILGAAGFAATMHLSLTPSLGQAYVVPYKTKDDWKATFQIGYKGLIQMAHRTGKYTNLHASKVYEGQIRGYDPFTGEFIRGDKISDEVIGYVSYMRLTNGFEKMIYMTIEELEAYAEKYSQSYAYDKRNNKKTSPWSTDFDSMAIKTVIKKLLRLWGVLTTDLALALQADKTVVDKNTFTYVDNGGKVQNRNEVYLPNKTNVDEETGEVIQEDEINDDDIKVEVAQNGDG